MSHFKPLPDACSRQSHALPMAATISGPWNNLPSFAVAPWGNQRADAQHSCRHLHLSSLKQISWLASSHLATLGSEQLPAYSSSADLCCAPEL